MEGFVATGKSYAGIGSRKHDRRNQGTGDAISIGDSAVSKYNNDFVLARSGEFLI